MANNENNSGNSFFVFFAFLWVILGLLGFLTSLFCFAYGSFMQNWVGLLTAVSLGPFYWVYFAFAGDQYCTAGGSKQQQKLQTRPAQQRAVSRRPSRNRGGGRGRSAGRR